MQPHLNSRNMATDMPVIAMPGACEPEVCDVLQLVLLHCPEASDKKALCNLLRASTAIRRAVQQARGHCHVRLCSGPGWSREEETIFGIERIVGFAAWLPNHAGLVSGLEVLRAGDMQWIRRVAEMALRLCAAGAAADARSASIAQEHAGAVKAVTATTSSPPPLRLSRFTAGYQVSPEVLQLLGGFAARSLHLQGMDPNTMTSSFSAALAQLSSLQELDLSHISGPIPHSLVAAVARLSLLTLNCSLAPADVEHLPPTLQHLDLRLEDVAGTDSTTSVERSSSFKHMTALQLLRLSRHPTSRSVLLLLPPTLNCIEVHGAMLIQGLRSVQEVVLEHLPETARYSAPLLRSLSQITSPFLLEQRLGMYNPQYAVEVAAALSHVSSITSLDLSAEALPGSPPCDIRWCASIAALTQLRALSLRVDRTSSSDVLHLSRLTGLTQLDLLLHSGLDDPTAVALTSALTRLQRLSLQGSMESLAVLPAVAQLTGLCDLRLICRRNLSLGPADLLQLSGLTRLRSLVVPLGHGCTASVVKKFLSGMPHLHRIV